LIILNFQNSLTRGIDLAVRDGGEEFLVLMPYTDEKGDINIAEKIRDNIKLKALEHKHSKIYSIITVSIGTSTLKK
jgi:diguanylate cyclase (GGDEF)-like protein